MLAYLASVTVSGFKENVIGLPLWMSHAVGGMFTDICQDDYRWVSLEMVKCVLCGLLSRNLNIWRSVFEFMSE